MSAAAQGWVMCNVVLPDILIPSLVISKVLTILLCVCLGVLCAPCICVGAYRGQKFPETGVTGDCELPSGCWKPNIGPPREQSELGTAESYLQP